MPLKVTPRQHHHYWEFQSAQTDQHTHFTQRHQQKKIKLN